MKKKLTIAVGVLVALALLSIPVLAFANGNPSSSREAEKTGIQMSLGSHIASISEEFVTAVEDIVPNYRENAVNCESNAVCQRNVVDGELCHSDSDDNGICDNFTGTDDSHNANPDGNGLGFRDENNDGSCDNYELRRSGENGAGKGMYKGMRCN